MARFFIDQSNQGIFPSDAIAILRREQTSERAIRYFGSLIEMSGGQGYGRSINLGPSNALLMMGTTPELQTEVAAASADQVNGVRVQDDYLVMHYLRYAEERTFMSTINRTVACIAGWQGYWGLSPNNQDDTNVRNAGWERLYPNAGEDWIPRNGSMPLMQPPWPNLHDVLTRLHGTQSWYNERGKRI
jgi:hypothetical protein